MNPRVVVIGDVMVDVVVRPTGPFAPTSDTPAQIRMSRGGAAANLAVALADCAIDVTYVGAAADDLARAFFERSLREAGVVPRLEIVEGATGVVVALIGEHAQRAMLTDRGANPTLSRGFALATISPSIDHVHVSGYTLLDEATRAVGIAVLRRAHELSLSSSVDVCSVEPLRRVGPDVFMDAAQHAKVLFANEEEALVLTGATHVDDALATLGELYDEVVITRGNAGALAQRGDVSVGARALETNAVDSTGAGDAATGTYLGNRLRRAGLQQSLDAGMVVAAHVVAGLGSRG